ncbi:DUF4173 domain-containing protein, partial [Plantactinospora sp. S1510]|nr:DUF4173 domain-containing protein [Plantactinospora alkalitolerans]
MSEPPPAPGLPAAAASDLTGGEATGDATPRLLVMSPGDGPLPPTMVWPGPEGQPGWAIPVAIPPGTRGYALFIPLVPAAAPAEQVTADAAPAPAPVPDTRAPVPTAAATTQEPGTANQASPVSVP